MIALKSESNRPPRRNRLVRVLLLLIAMAAVASLAEHWRGRWALNSWKRDMAAKGEVFEASRLWPSASSKHVEFANQLGQVTAQLHGKLGQYAGKLTPMLMAAPDRCRRGSQESQLPFWDKRVPTNTWQDLDELCQQSQPILQTLYELMKDPPPSKGYDVRKHLEDNSLPNFVSIRYGAQSLHAVVMNDLHKGDLSGAVSDLGSLASFGRLYEQDPTLVNYMIRIAFLGMTIDVGWDALQADGWTETQLASLQKLCLDNGRLLSQMPRTLEAERAERIYRLQWFRAHAYRKWLDRNQEIYESFGAKLPAEDAAESIVFWRHWFFHPIWSFAWADQEELAYLRHQQLDLMVLREAVQHRSSLRVKEQMAANHKSYRAPAAAWRFYMQMPLVDRMVEVVTAKPPASPPKPSPQITITPTPVSAAKPPAPAYKPHPQLTTPKPSIRTLKLPDPDCPYSNFSRAWLTTMRNLTMNEMVITAIALKRYELRHGHLPSSLAALAPQFLAAVPSDFMDGQPLRYRLSADGSFTLYSVGFDMHDDDGDSMSESHTDIRNVSLWDGRDWVWPRVAPGVEGLQTFNTAR